MDAAPRETGGLNRLRRTGPAPGPTSDLSVREPLGYFVQWEDRAVISRATKTDDTPDKNTAGKKKAGKKSAAKKGPAKKSTGAKKNTAKERVDDAKAGREGSAPVKKAVASKKAVTGKKPPASTDAPQPAAAKKDAAPPAPSSRPKPADVASDANLVRLHQDLLKDADTRTRPETLELREKLCRRVVRSPERLEDVMSGLEHDSLAVKYGCSSLLRMISDRKPEMLVDHWKEFTKQLESETSYLRWDAISIVANLAGAVNKRRLDTILERYLEPIQGPVLVTAANTIGAAARLAERQPKVASEVVDGILQVGRAKYATPDCKDIAIGQAITALGSIYGQLDDPARVLRFVRRQRDNKRAATQAKAERFLDRHEKLKKKA